ncbi:ANTAR domain-containing protein [Arthrobacter sp. TMN-37]
MSLAEAVSSIEYFIDCPTGTVEQYFADGVLRWSGQPCRIRGYERGDIGPTLELGLSHVEPHDRDAMRAFWDNVPRTGGPLSVYSSIRDVNGQLHKILLSADLLNDGGEPVGVWGLVVDLTRSIHADQHQLADEAVAASALNRAVIEQAKGILMGRAGLNAADAFKRISQYSQRTNRKVVVSSQQIIDRAQQLNGQDKHQSSTETLLDLFQVLRKTT